MQQGTFGASEVSLESGGVAVRTRKELAELVEQLYHDYYDTLYSYLLLSGCTPADAEEYLQDAYMRLVRFLQQGKAVDKPKPWLLRVLHNIRHDEQQRSSRFLAMEPEDLEALSQRKAMRGPNPESEALERERLERVRTAMSQLTERQYQYMLLRAEGLKLREIAELHGVAVASVAEACGRAMEKLGRLTHE